MVTRPARLLPLPRNVSVALQLHRANSTKPGTFGWLLPRCSPPNAHLALGVPPEEVRQQQQHHTQKVMACMAATTHISVQEERL